MCETFVVLASWCGTSQQRAPWSSVHTKAEGSSMIFGRNFVNGHHYS
jgi:hypothetical protein